MFPCSSSPCSFRVPALLPQEALHLMAHSRGFQIFCPIFLPSSVSLSSFPPRCSRLLLAVFSFILSTHSTPCVLVQTVSVLTVLKSLSVYYPVGQDKNLLTPFKSSGNYMCCQVHISVLCVFLTVYICVSCNSDCFVIKWGTPWRSWLRH